MNSISTSLPSVANVTSSFSGGDLSSLRREKPEDLAQQFEGLFVSMLVKEMRKTSGPGQGMFPGDDSDTYGGIFDMYMGQHIAENGGIGLAKSISAAIQKQNGTYSAAQS